MPDADVAKTRTPWASHAALAVALSTGFVSLVLVGPFMWMIALPLLLVSVTAWALSIVWLPKGAGGARASHALLLVLVPLLLLGPAGELVEATGSALMWEQRAETMIRGSGAQYAIRQLREAREASARADYWLWASVLLGLAAAGLQVVGTRWRTGEPPSRGLLLVLVALFAAFGPLAQYVVRALVAGGWPLTT